jgi:hypothetical protein
MKVVALLFIAFQLRGILVDENIKSEFIEKWELLAKWDKRSKRHTLACKQDMKKRIIVALLVGVIVGIGAAKFYMAALHAGHTALFFPDYVVGVIVGGLSAIITFKHIKK